MCFIGPVTKSMCVHDRLGASLSEACNFPIFPLWRERFPDKLYSLDRGGQQAIVLFTKLQGCFDLKQFPALSRARLRKVYQDRREVL